MSVAVGATWVFALLLAVAGVRKLTAPAATGAALQGARLPADARLVRLLGAGELLLAAAVLGLGGAVPAVALALTYLAFTGFAGVQSRRGAGCGCFGDAETPATPLHVAIDVVGAVVALIAAIGQAPSVPAALGSQAPLAGVLALVLLGLATMVALLALTALPELAVAAALVSERDTA